MVDLEENSQALLVRNILPKVMKIYIEI